MIDSARRLPLLGAALLAAACASTLSEGSPQPEETATAAQADASPTASTADETQATPSTPAERLRWQLEVEPGQMTMAQRSGCRVRLQVTNVGEANAAPQAHLGRFTLNGEESQTLSLAFSNGTIEQRWLELPPGETATMERELCETLFPTPGEYTIGFQRGGSSTTGSARVSP